VLASTALLLAVSAASVATSRGDQSLSVYPAQAAAGRASGRPVVLVLSGEGGWRSFDDQLATMLAGAGYWVGGFDSLKYFWKPQDDRGALAADVSRCADALIEAAGSRAGTRVVLVGYSFGADLAPWIAGASNKDPRIAALIMIGPDRTGSLEARVVEILGWKTKSHTFDTSRALADLRSIPVLFVHGGKDESSEAPDLAASFAGRKALTVVPGASHHFGGHEDEFRRAVVDGLRQILAQ
jgi:type IV secretory pathway VirJ component